MNFSEKRLVSFGDSYTFGQACTLESDFSKILKDNYNKNVPIEQQQALWKQLSNDGSYTEFVKRKLNFKSSINLGAPGAANKSIYDIMYNYCALNDTSNDFFIVSLTSPERESVYSRRIDTGKYSATTLNIATLEHAKKSKQYNVELHRDLPLNTAKEWMLHMNNDITVLSKLIHTIDSIISLLEKNNIPYIIFDCINMFSSFKFIKKMDIENEITTSFFNLIFKDTATDFVYDSDIRLKNFYDDIVNEKLPTYLNHHTINKYFDNYPGTGIPIKKEVKESSMLSNLNNFVTSYGSEVLGNIDDVLSPVPGDSHWSVKGHKFAAMVLSEWITRHYA